MKTNFIIYRNSATGRLSLQDHSCMLPNGDWEQYLREAGQGERADRLCAMSSRKRSPKIYKIRHTDAFKAWSEANPVTVKYTEYAEASAEYDGRLREGAIKRAILDATQYNEKRAMVVPESDKNKPAHLRRVYVFNYKLDYIL